MYIVRAPPLPAIADVSFTHAVAEVELDPLLLHVLEQDSSHALSGELQALSAQNLTFPRLVAS